MNSLRLVCALLFVSLALLAQRQMTVAQLVNFVQSSLQMRNEDQIGRAHV